MDRLSVWNRRQTSPTVVPHVEKGDNTVHLRIMVEERTLLCVCVSCKWQMMRNLARFHKTDTDHRFDIHKSAYNRRIGGRKLDTDAGLPGKRVARTP